MFKEKIGFALVFIFCNNIIFLQYMAFFDSVFLNSIKYKAPIMPQKKKKTTDVSNLRQKVEEALKSASVANKDPVIFSPDEMKRFINELEVYQIELEMQNDELRRSQVELETQRGRYFDFYNMAPVGFFSINEKKLIFECNLTAAKILEKNRNDIINQPITRFIIEADQDIYCLYNKKLFETHTPQGCDLRMQKNDGSALWVHLKTTVVQNAGATVNRLVISDITLRKKAEALLEKANDGLKEKTAVVEDMNAALRVLLQKREKDNQEIEENILYSYESIVIPFLHKLKSSTLNKNQQNLLNIVETNLKEIVAPFSKKLANPLMRLTPTEIQIAAMIKQGFSNKEIAQILHNSVRTITKHRDHIREKLNLKNKKINLRSYLSNV